MSADDRPVLVIHGVATRSYEAFDKDVANLQRGIGPGWRLIRVYWGDIAAQVAGIADTVPAREFSRDARLGAQADRWSKSAGEAESIDDRRAIGLAMLAARSGEAEAVGESVVDPVGAVRAAALLRLEQLGVTGVDREVADLTEANRNRLELVASATDPEVLQQLGVTIAERYVGAATSIPAGPEAIWPLDLLRDIVDNAIGAIHDVIGDFADDVGGAVNRLVREFALIATGTGIGDVVLYQGNRQAIQDRVSQCLRDEADGWGQDGRPIPVLGHSLGGIIAFDMAVREHEPLWIDPLVTFGSQSSVLHVFDPRLPNVPRYTPGNRAAVPDRIGRWLNLWSTLDPLAFSAGRIFRTAPADRVEDVRITYRGDTDLFTHDAYWTDPYMAAETRRALERAGDGPV